jgi:hypothetical protein
MPTNLPVRRAVARRPGEAFFFPLLVLAVLITMAMGSILLFPARDYPGMEDLTATVAAIAISP